MSDTWKIPYLFETPVPKYFSENGWLPKDKPLIYHRNHLFLSWSFSKCSKKPRRQFFDCKELDLVPFEFICGRERSSKECGLKEGVFRNQLKIYENAGLLEKTTNSVTNRFTCYRWVTERFNENHNQLDAQPATNRQPTDQPQTRNRYTDIKEQQQEILSDVVDSEKEDRHKDHPNGKVTPIYGGWQFENEGYYEMPSRYREDPTIAYIIRRPEDKEEITTRLAKTLEDKGLSIQEITLLNKHYSVERIIAALHYGLNVEIKKTLIATMRWHCNQAAIIIPEIVLPPEQRVQKYFKHGERYNGAECIIEKNDCIAFERGMKNRHVKFSARNFNELMREMLNEFEIEIPEEFEIKTQQEQTA